MEIVVNYLKNFLSDVKTKYAVDPIIFAIIYFIGVIPFWYSIYRIGRGIKRGNQNEIMTFSTILGLIILAPFTYVMIYGRNLPFYVWIVAVVVIGLTAYSTIKKIIKKKDQEEKL